MRWRGRAASLADEGLVIGDGGQRQRRRRGRPDRDHADGRRARRARARDVAIVDREGKLVDGRIEPTSELGLHLGIYARHGAGAVVHTHAPVATALSCVLDELPCVHYSMLLLGGTVPVAPYETFGTPELAEAVVESLVGHTAALMANHGAVTFAEDIAAALDRMRCSSGRARSTGAPVPSASRTCSTPMPGPPPSAQRSSAVTARPNRPTGTAVRVVTMGVHVLDVLVRPVEEIPEGQGGQLVEQIRITAAGSAGGTALTLAKLGAEVRSAGAIGTDEVGEMLVTLLERAGIDTSMLIQRDGVQTSASVLPIRPDGSRPAFHVVGANATYVPGDVELGRVRRRHPPAPWRARVHGRRGGRRDPRERARARDRHLRRRTRPRRAGRARVDRSGAPAPRLLPPQRRPGARLHWHVDDLEEACRSLVERGAGCVAATCGADGVILVDAEGTMRVPAFDVEVVDTTGCGDAFSAGFLRGLSLDRDRAAAAALGCAAAGLVAVGSAPITASSTSARPTR